LPKGAAIQRPTQRFREPQSGASRDLGATGISPRCTRYAGAREQRRFSLGTSGSR